MFGADVMRCVFAGATPALCLAGNTVIRRTGTDYVGTTYRGLVREAGLEPARLLRRQDLNLVRLPISPLSRRKVALYRIRGRRCERFPRDRFGQSSSSIHSLTSSEDVNSSFMAFRCALYAAQVMRPVKNSFCRRSILGV